MSGSETAATLATGRYRLWDVPTRVFHWTLVALLGLSWWTGENHDMDRHRLSGYAILALIAFRVFWGFVGGRSARFTQFVRGPAAVAGYVRAIAARRHAAVFGHNPLGGWSVLALLATLGVMVVTGLFAVDIDGLESGPLSDRVGFDTGRLAAQAHHWCFDVLLALMAVHVVAIVFYLVVLRRNLIGPMISGWQRRRAGEALAIEDLRSSWRRAALGIVLAGGIAYAVSRGLRAPI